MSSRSLALALAVVAAAFMGFAWWVYVATAGRVHIAVPIACTVGPILIAGLSFVGQRLLARKNASALESALVADGAKQKPGAARNPEIDRLRREFDRAVGALKSSKLGRSSGNAQDALYRLPWYTIIGPPACGKTTVLRNSGLKFPHLAGTGDRLKGVGGTRN